MAKHKSKRSDPVLLPESRITWPYCHERRTKNSKGVLLTRKLEDGTVVPAPRHEAGVCVPKLHNDPTQCSNYKMLAGLCMDAATKEWGKWPEGGYWPIRDGDAPPKAKAPVPGQPVTPVDPNKYAYQRGHWVIEVSSNSEVGPRICVMQGGQAIEIPARVINNKAMYKGGDYGHVSAHAYTFFNETWGCKFGFEGVLFTREGEAIGGSGGPRAAADMFAGVATVGTAPLPQTYAQPAAPAPQAYAQPVAASPPLAPQQYAQPGPAYAPPPPNPAVPMPPPAPGGAPGLPPFPR